MYAETGGPNVKWRGTDFKWRGRAPLPPGWRGPSLISRIFSMIRFLSFAVVLENFNPSKNNSK